MDTPFHDVVVLSALIPKDDRHDRRRLPSGCCFVFKLHGTRRHAASPSGPVAPVLSFDTVDEAIEIVRRSEYGRSPGILTRDVMKGLSIADRIPTGIVHINDQTVDDESVAPFGASGKGARFGGVEANLEAFTETQWVTMQGDIARYPF